MNENIIALAAKTLKIDIEEAKKHCKEIPEINAYYFWNPIRGGTSVIINSDGEKLAATSAVSFEKHKQAFLSGKRN